MCRWLKNIFGIKPRIICDTNVWYDIASGKIPITKLDEVTLYATYVNLFELSKSKNLLKNWRLVKYAVKAIKMHAKGVIEIHPFDYMILQHDRTYKSKNDDHLEILSGFEALLKMDDCTQLDNDTLTNMSSSIQQFLTNAKAAADVINTELPKLRAAIKADGGKRKYRKLSAYAATQAVLSLFIQKYSKEQYKIIDLDYPWRNVEFMLKVWDRYFKELELSGNQKFRPNDWWDIMSMAYVKGDYFYSTDEDTWVKIIEAHKDTSPKLFKLTA